MRLNPNRLMLLASMANGPLAAVGLAVVLFASSVSKAAEPSDDPIPQSEIDLQGASCRAGQDRLRHWFDLYCACIGRTAPHLFTATQFRAITRTPISDELLKPLGIARAKIEQMIASCQREAEPASSNPPKARDQTTTDVGQLTSDDINARARTLRTKLNEAYHSGSSHPNPFDVTDIVVPYISVGTSFRDAEAVLRMAGFTVWPHPDMSKSLNINRSRNWYAVVAEIRSFDSGGFMRTDLDVLLEPGVPGHYTTISRLLARFRTTGP